MNKLFLVSFFFLSTTKVFSADYQCYTNLYKLSFHSDSLASSLEIEDRTSGSLIFSAFVKSIETDQKYVNFLFDDLRRNEVTLIFKNSDIQRSNSPLLGLVSAPMLNTTLSCHKK
jgi:hypothetical protein